MVHISGFWFSHLLPFPIGCDAASISPSGSPPLNSASGAAKASKSPASGQPRLLFGAPPQTRPPRNSAHRRSRVARRQAYTTPHARRGRGAACGPRRGNSARAAPHAPRRAPKPGRAPEGTPAQRAAPARDESAPSAARERERERSARRAAARGGRRAAPRRAAPPQAPPSAVDLDGARARAQQTQPTNQTAGLAAWRMRACFIQGLGVCRAHGIPSRSPDRVREFGEGASL